MSQKGTHYYRASHDKKSVEFCVWITENDLLVKQLSREAAFRLASTLLKIAVHETDVLTTT